MARRVSWSDRAEDDLRRINPAAVRDQIRRNAEEILHRIPPQEYPVDEGSYGGIMWHRAIKHEQPTEQDNGPVKYFLLYRRGEPPEFEVEAVRSLEQMGGMWLQMTRGPRDPF